MKKIISLASLLVVLATSAYAEYEQSGSVDGYKVYQQKCQMCHKEMLTKKEALASMKKLKAPPMNEVSARLKENIITKEDDEDVNRELILTFMRDYIMNPNIEKTMCHMGAVDKFGVMPSQKGKLNSAELHAVTEWIHDHYSGKIFK